MHYYIGSDFEGALYGQQGYFNQEMIDKAHENGIRCNVFYADDADEAKKYLEMGIDTILTNDYLYIKNTLGI